MSNCSEYVLADDIPVDPPTENRDVPGGNDDVPKAATDGGPTLEEVLRVVFDIGIGERETYEALSGQEPSSAGDLAEDLGRDRSNVNRYLNNLFQKGLVTRRRRILQSGGHVYEYSTRSSDHVRALLLAGLREWSDAAHDHIDELLAESETAPGTVA